MYTKDKVKKSKTWHDGYVILSSSGRAQLFSEDQESLDTGSFPVSSFVPDATIEFERFLVELSGEPSSAPPPPKLPSVQTTAASRMISNNSNMSAKAVSFQENHVPAPPEPVLYIRPNVAPPNAPPPSGAPSRSLADVLSMLKGGGGNSSSANAAPVLPAPVLHPRATLIPVAVAAAPRPSFDSLLASHHSMSAEPPAKRQNIAADNAVARSSQSVKPTTPNSFFLCGPIRWPTRDQVRNAPRTLTVQIPERFDTVREYSNIYSNAVRETINMQLCRVADTMYSLLAKSGGSVGSEALFRSARIEAYGSCHLTTKEWRGLKGKVNVSLVLQLPNGWMTRSRGEHSKDDLWAVSFSGTFDHDVVLLRTVFHGISQSGSVNMELMPHQNGPLVARSGTDSCLVNPAFKGQQNVCVYRLLSASTELQELLTLAALGEGDPLVNNLVMPRAPLRLPAFTPFPPLSVTLNAAQIKDVQLRIASEFNLNQEQRTVLDRVANWFTSRSNADNITLVHGVFGAGKSTLLVAIILFLVEVMDKADVLSDERKSGGVVEEEDDVVILDDDDDDDGECIEDNRLEEDQKPQRSIRMRPPPFRIAISSSTNTAVDRVLEGLMDAGCKDFLRVGSIKKMSRRVLPFTLYEEEKDAIFELRKQLRDEELGSGERADLEKELEELVSGRAGKRKERLGLCPIVGTTCSASLFKLFKDHQFSVVMLDECSQMVEPLSLLPIKSFEPRKLIWLGRKEKPKTKEKFLMAFSNLVSEILCSLLPRFLLTMVPEICLLPCFLDWLLIILRFFLRRSIVVIQKSPIWRRASFMKVVSSPVSLSSSEEQLSQDSILSFLWTPQALVSSPETVTALGAMLCIRVSLCNCCYPRLRRIFRQPRPWRFEWA